MFKIIFQINSYLKYLNNNILLFLESNKILIYLIYLEWKSSSIVLKEKKQLVMIKHLLIIIKLNNSNIINKNDLQITFLKEKNEKENNNNIINKIYPYIQDENEKFYYFSRKLNSNILFLINNKNAIEFIYKELIYSKAKKEYINRILK